MRVAVVGTRTFSDYDYLHHKLSHVLRQGDVIVTGDAPGVDALAIKWAGEHGYKVSLTADIVAAADTVIAFWDGKSSETMNVIKQAVLRGLRVGIYPISQTRVRGICTRPVK